ncbi:MAG: hypothetical protein ACFFDB_00560 [Promethearchaeota archaeon]
MNNQHKVFITGIILLLAYVIPYTLIFMAEVPIESEEESESVMEIEETEEIRIFPDDYLTNISDISFLSGSPVSGSIESLAKKDSNKLVVEPEWNLGGYWEYDIRFKCSDLSEYNLEFYDLWLYLDIDDPVLSPGIVYLQANSSLKWVNIVQIDNSRINLVNEYVENVAEFRLYGNLGAIKKELSIDRMTFLQSHNKEYNYRLGVVNFTTHNFTENVGTTPSFTYEDNWWLGWYNDPYDITYGVSGSGVPYDWGEFVLNGSLTNITNGGDIKERTGSRCRFYYKFYAAAVSKFELYQWDYNTISWSYRDHYWWSYGSGSVAGWTGNWGIGDSNFRVDNGVPYYAHRLWLRADSSSSFQFKAADTYLLAYLNGTAFNIENNNYPEITNIQTIPSSPLSENEEFKLQADIRSSSPYNTIAGAKVYIYDLNNPENNLGWLDMNYSGDGDEWFINSNGSLFNFGNVGVWINATNSNGESSLNYTTFQINDSRPRITIDSPTENEEVSQLYGFSLNISVNDWDALENVSVKIYDDDELNPELDWVNMTHTGGNKYIYIIDPVDYPNNLYTVEFRAADQIGYGYNSTQMLIQNNPPSIEIISPSITEFTIPSNYSIECNISNEEPINSAQWDIVQSLGAYNWKNLTYNPISEYYEANFSLLDYEYGDYYLVINATDDKFNSSLEIKSIELHPFITYIINETDITHTSSDITVSGNPAQSTPIIGEITLNHHPIAKERDWEILLPQIFNDSYEYYIIRGEKYEPIGLNEGNHTIWHIPLYQAVDIVYFHLEQPKITNDPSGLIEIGDRNYELRFTLSTKHRFTNLTISHTLDTQIPKPENYEYELFYNLSEGWIKFSGEIQVSGNNGNFKFDWNLLNASSFIEFLYKAHLVIPYEEDGDGDDEEISENNLMYLLSTGGIISGIGTAIWGSIGYYLFKKQKLKKNGLIRITITVGVGLFFLGLGIGFLIM